MLQTARTIRIHLFGRPHLTEDAAPLKFKAPARALSLLAYLLVDAPAPLTRDVVAFALWPDDVEADARANLRRHLFYLVNDVLPAAPKTPWILADKRTIGWNSAAPAWCDVQEFERLRADPATAQQAVELYSGDLLVGYEDEWLQLPRERLRERQVQLLLDLIQKNQRSNAHADGIAYARRLLTIDPWREDAIRALIDLRNAAGDRSGALATYRDFVKRLEAEMGVPPMPETTAVYERVASASATSSVPTEGAEVVSSVAVDDANSASGTESVADDAAVPNPFWRPPESISNADAVRPVSSFTGRDAELSLLDTALWDRTGRAAIHGLSGVGKSALAREYARRRRDRYAAVWWLNADTEAGIIDGFVRLGSEFVPALAKVDDRRSAAEQVTANVLTGLTKPVLLVFDNLDDERLLRRWIPDAPVQVLVTSRHAIVGGEIVAIRLPPWEPDETIRYLQRETGRADLTDADALLLAQTLGFLPLALAHAAAYLKGTINVTAQRYLERINDHLDRAPRGADYDRAVYATFREAIVRAEGDAPGAAALLCLAACFAADALPEELFTQASGTYAPLTPPIPQTAQPVRSLRATTDDGVGMEDALGALHRFSLLTFLPDTRTYTLHRLVGTSVRMMLADDVGAWAQTAVVTLETAFPQSDFEFWPSCERLVAHARAALDALPQAACFAPAARLALRCGQYLRKRAAFAEAEDLLRRGLAIAETCHANDVDMAIAEHVEALAALLRDTNRLGEAEPLHRRALELRETTSGPLHPSVSAALNDLAILLHYSSRLSEAEALYRRALDTDAAGSGAEHPIVALRMHNLALVLHETNRPVEAESLLRRALLIDERVHGALHPDVASDLGNLGWLVLEAGRIDEAEPLLRRAVDIREAAFGPNHPSYAHALSDVAALLHDTDRMTEAEQLYGQAFAIYEASYGAHHPVVAACLNNMAELLVDAGRFDEAESMYRRALASDEATYGPEHTNVARDLNNLAGLLAASGRTPQAAPLLQRALAIVAATYEADHPRVQAVRANQSLLIQDTGMSQSAQPKLSTSWRNIRRSPSRGLR